MTLFQMDFFLFILVLMLIVGGVFIVFAGLGFGGSQDVPEEKKEDALAQKMDALNNYVSEADEAITELNDMSKNIFREFDSKYQELLFLYNLIEQKQKNIDKVPFGAEYTQRLDSEAAVPNDKRRADINPKFANVLELHSGGNSIEEIAKQLNMGKGEISLILNLTGGGGNA
jgi:uncharacterized protein YneR